MTRRDVLSRLAIPFPIRSALGLCVLLGFQPLVLQGQDKLKPLAVQKVGEFQVEVWSVDPIEPQKLTEKFGSAASGIGFDVDQMMSRVGSPSSTTPTSPGTPGFPGPGAKKLTNSHILGLQLRNQQGELIPGVVEAAKGATSVDDLGNSNAEVSIGDRRHAYQWDRPYLVPLPVAVAEGAKEVAKLDGKLIVQPGMHATIEIKGEQLKSKEPFRGGVFAVMLNGMETKEDTLAFGYSLFMPVPKQDNNSKDFMAAMQAASLQPEIRAVLIDENGVAYSSTRNSSLNVKRNVDVTTTRSLQQELSARMKGYEPKNTKEQTKTRTKISYELNVNNYMTQFSKVPPGTKIRALQLTIVKPTAQAFPVSYSLQHIPLDVRRSSAELAAACNTQVANEAMDSNESPDMNVVKSEVTVEKNGTGIKTNTVLSGSGVQTNTTNKSTSPATALAEESPLFASEPKAGGYRTWRDASGSFSVEAILVKSDGKSVQLKKKDGKIVTVPLEKLSDADKKFLSK